MKVLMLIAFLSAFLSPNQRSATARIAFSVMPLASPVRADPVLSVSELLPVDGWPVESEMVAVEVPKPVKPKPRARTVRAPVDPMAREIALGKLAELGATPKQLEIWDCVGSYESGWRSDAVSPTSDFGVLQINISNLRRLFPGQDPFDPAVNAEMAWTLWTRSGGSWRAWTVAPKCNV